MNMPGSAVHPHQNNLGCRSARYVLTRTLSPTHPFSDPGRENPPRSRHISCSPFWFERRSAHARRGRCGIDRAHSGPSTRSPQLTSTVLAHWHERWGAQTEPTSTGSIAGPVTRLETKLRSGYDVIQGYIKRARGVTCYVLLRGVTWRYSGLDE